jgi:hypothetical protein
MVTLGCEACRLTREIGHLAEELSHRLVQRCTVMSHTGAGGRGWRLGLHNAHEAATSAAGYLIPFL